MKTQIITTITAALLIVFKVSAYAQSKEDCLRLLKKNECTQAEIDAAKAKNQQLNNQISNQISRGIERQEKVIMNSKEGDGAKYDLANANRNNQNAVKSESIEQMAELAKIEITEGIDFIKTNESVKLVSKKGFEAYTYGLSESLKKYNEDLLAYKKASQEYKDAYEKETMMMNDQNKYSVKDRNTAIDDANAKYKMMKNLLGKVESSQNNALKNAKVLSESTKDPTFKKKIEDLVDPLMTKDMTGKKYPANVTENSKTVSDDYKNLITNYLSGCTDCGK